MNRIAKYISRANDIIKKNPIGSYSLLGLQIYIKDPLPYDIDIEECVRIIFSKIPRIMRKNVKSIQVGNFSFLNKRNVQAIYKKGVVYVTNQQNNNKDLVSDIVHEISHAFESTNEQALYSDNLIRSEFLEKRRTLFRNLKANNLLPTNFTEDDFLKTEYSIKFDELLYQKIGYEKLWNFTKGIFASPYGATSLREYFANAFEIFFVDDIDIIRKVSPQVYKKIIKYLEF